MKKQIKYMRFKSEKHFRKIVSLSISVIIEIYNDEIQINFEHVVEVIKKIVKYHIAT